MLSPCDYTLLIVFPPLYHANCFVEEGSIKVPMFNPDNFSLLAPHYLFFYVDIMNFYSLLNKKQIKTLQMLL